MHRDRKIALKLCSKEWLIQTKDVHITVMALSGWEEIMKCSEGVNEMSGLGGGGGGGGLAKL